MLIFSTNRFSALSYRADFIRHPYANISFFDTDRQRILFHLSLRQEGGLAVCNRRGDGHGTWEKEIHQQVTLNPDGNRVELRFDPPRISVFLNGQRIFRFGARIGRPRFPDLGQIALVDYQGGIQASTIDMTHKGVEGPGLTLTPRLDLRGRLDRQYQPGELRLEIDGLSPAPALITSTDAAGTALWSVLPGRVWQGCTDEAPLTVRIMQADTVRAQQVLHRAGLLAQVQAALETGDLAGDPVLATQIIEHARFSGIAALLEPPLRDRLMRLADQLGLDRFLDPGDQPDDPPLSTTPAPEDTTLQEMLAEVAQALNKADTPDALSRLLEGLAPPPEAMRPLFYAALAEPFCRRDAFDLLHAHAQAHTDMAAVPPGEDAWFNSGLLPYLLRDLRIDELCQLLNQLVNETERWIMTPPLAWTIRAALADPKVTNAERENIISAFLNFLNRRAGDYWQRTPCAQLTETAIALIADCPRLNPRLTPWIETMVLRTYGMSCLFWTRIAERDVTISPQLTVARDAFAVLTNSGSMTGTQADALALFDRIGCPDAPRIRRDLFGPVGLPGPEAPTVAALMGAGLDPTEAALRHLAAPDSPAAEPALEETVRLSRASLPDLVDRAPHYALQCTTSRRAMELLATARAGDDPKEGCAALLPDLDRLTDAAAHWIGAGLALGLLNGLLDAGADMSADCLQTWLKQALHRAETEKSDPADPARTPALAMPLHALRRRAAAGQITATASLAALEISAATADVPPALPLGPANPLFDTLVLVISCRANLDRRIPQLRAGWLSRLEALGVPYLIVAGDGDGTIEGDILHLDAPDDYEGLPQKSLTAIRWVHDNTAFAHMLKIDDDCFLNPEEYFQSLSFRKFDYYGRTLTRSAGQMDRAWHCTKSTSDRGRLEFDKSPEPSSYCDGGSGYALSRHAMTALLKAAASTTGQALIQVSFMEDKLVGDLLALGGIAPANEDYHISIRRRAQPGGIAVSRWLNGFDASRTAPVKLVHLDDSATQVEADRRLDEPGLFPKKIWPSYQRARLGEQTNALEMVSDAARLGPAREAPVAVVAAMRNEMFMLPHFLAHYRALGVESFLIADNCSTDGTLEYLVEQPDVALFSVDTDYNRSHYGVAWQQALMAHLRTGKWSLVADADELLTWQVPQRQSLPDLLQEPAFEHAEAARIFMLDMYPQGDLDTATFASGDPFAEAGFTDREPFLRHSFGRGPYSNAPTWTSAVRHRLIPGSRNELFVAQKIALFKYSPFLRLSAGLHYVAGARLAERELLFGHFKYNSDFRRKAQAEVARRQHFNNAEEYRKYLALSSEGRARIYDPDLSVAWTDSAFVKARLL
ncbi:glycosyltransferase family 2 protein [Ruegeria sp. 2205SS24-7]|uniref:glycosyltransferase family 2 protein n=1 Tax=Ruegeria discodermiae TaxID=3064389 RepID=UPI0027423DA9|nr:glycosyltransferase family 2 protein [Ruegeria sp. 2205SS24-7]MDP5220746.1 glycosyltransferase family 2 protein [Ruegeria sp. 2205SS24-7]